MIQFLVFCTVLATAIVVVMAMGDIGPGRWYVLSIQQCKDYEKYEHQFFIQRKKLTRDQDCYNANMSLETTIDDSFAIRIDLCKHVDGGCKPFQVLSDDSIVKFLEKYAKNNIEQALKMTGKDPPEFPLEPGFYELKEYVFNYCELPTDGMFGKFGAEGYVIKDQKEVGCVSFTVEFREIEGACDGEDEEVDDDDY